MTRKLEKSMARRIILYVLVLAAIAAGYGIYEFNRGPKSLENVSPAWQIDASDLANGFLENEEEANQKFLGKVIEVRGKLSDVINDSTSTSIVLETTDMMTSIICELADNIDTDNLVIGDSLTVKGECSGFLMDVVLTKSIIES